MPDKSIYTYWGKGPGKAEKNPELLFEKENKPTKSFHLGISVKDFDKDYKGEVYKQTDTDTLVVGIADSFIFGSITDNINI